MALWVGGGGVGGFTAAGDGDGNGVPWESAPGDGNGANEIVAGASLAGERIPIGLFANIAGVLRAERGIGRRPARTG